MCSGAHLVITRALWMAATLCIGCAPSLREAGELATSGATKAVGTPANLQRIETIAESPEARKALSDISAAAMQGAVGTGVDAALLEATTRENERRMREIAALFADSAVRTALHDFATGPEVQAGLSAMAFEVSRQSVLGANEATKELEQTKPNQGLIAHAASALSEWGVAVLVGVFAVLLITLLALTVGLFRTRAEVSRLRVEREHDGDGQRPRSGAPAPA